MSTRALLLSFRQVAALCVIAPKKGGSGKGVPTVRLGGMAEAFGDRTCLRLRPLQAARRDLLVTGAGLSRAKKVGGDCDELAVRVDHSVEFVWTDSSRVMDGQVTEEPASSAAVAALATPESGLAATCTLDAKVLLKLARALAIAAENGAGATVSLEVPQDPERPLRFTWAGGEAFMAQVVREGGEEAHPRLLSAAEPVAAAAPAEEGGA